MKQEVVEEPRDKRKLVVKTEEEEMESQEQAEAAVRGSASKCIVQFEDIDDELAGILEHSLEETLVPVAAALEHAMPSGLTAKAVGAAVHERISQHAHWPVTIEELQEAVMIQLGVLPEDAPACVALQAVVQVLGASAGPTFVSMSSSPDLTSTSQAESSVPELSLVPGADDPDSAAETQGDDPGSAAERARGSKNITLRRRTKLEHLRAVWPNWPTEMGQSIDPYMYEKK